MPKELNDPALIVFNLAVLSASIGTGLYLLARRHKGPWLPFEPRRLVPWNYMGALPALAIVLLTVGLAFSQSDPPTAERFDNDLYVVRLASAIVQEVFIVACCLALVAVGFKATVADLGLPQNFRNLLRDVPIGLIAGVAVVAPVYLIMLLLQGPNAESGHPLIKMLESGQPDLFVMILATLMAVVVAPVCEEITFRLLLQGWLERREWLAARQSEDLSISQFDALSQTTQGASPGNEVSLPLEASSSDELAAAELTSTDARGLVAVEPPSHGWPSIAISSLLFALAHLGYGPDPIPLFFLALVLGYLYFRTHRVIPCIVAHAFFNAFAMAQLWWMIFQPGEK